MCEWLMWSTTDRPVWLKHPAIMLIDSAADALNDDLPISSNETMSLYSIVLCMLKTMWRQWCRHEVTTL